MSPLTTTDVDLFLRDGILHVPTAIPHEHLEPMRDAIWRRLELGAVRRDDPSTWGGATGIHMNRIAHLPVFSSIGSPRLCAAIDDLVGAGRWKQPASWGQFAITMPQPGPAWEPSATGWHSDSGPVHSASDALFVLVLLADLAPAGGGTLLVGGSHRALADYIALLTPQDFTRSARAHRGCFARSRPWLAQLNGLEPVAGPRSDYFSQPAPPTPGGPALRLIEVQGKAGDAFLCHPYTYHAVSCNRASTPRMMRIKMLRLWAGEQRDDPSSTTPLARSTRPLAPPASTGRKGPEAAVAPPRDGLGTTLLPGTPGPLVAPCALPALQG